MTYRLFLRLACKARVSSLENWYMLESWRTLSISEPLDRYGTWMELLKAWLILVSPRTSLSRPVVPIMNSL